MQTTESINFIQEATDLPTLYPILNENQMTAGWHKKRPSLWSEPRTDYKPSKWSYEVGKTALDQAALWMDTEMAERRNLLLFNRVTDNDYDTVRSLVAAYQMVKPGEYARAHRHSPNALRIVLEAAADCYTVVDGVKLPMLPGDLLLTPGNAWHSHFNHGNQNAYWIDILDVPLVHRLEPMFVEHFPGGEQPITEEYSTHPFIFSLQEIKKEIEKQLESNGYRTITINSGDILKTMTIAYHNFLKGIEHHFTRNTANRVFCVIDGSGIIKIDNLSFDFKFGDIIAIPIWKNYTVIAQSNTTIIEVSDQRTMELLGFYKEENRKIT